MRVEAAIRDAVALVNDVRISSIAKRSASALARHVLVDTAAVGGLLALLIAGDGAWYALQRPAALAREPLIAMLPFSRLGRLDQTQSACRASWFSALDLQLPPARISRAFKFRSRK